MIRSEHVQFTKIIKSLQVDITKLEKQIAQLKNDVAICEAGKAAALLEIEKINQQLQSQMS